MPSVRRIFRLLLLSATLTVAAGVLVVPVDAWARPGGGGSYRGGGGGGGGGYRGGGGGSRSGSSSSGGIYYGGGSSGGGADGGVIIVLVMVVVGGLIIYSLMRRGQTSAYRDTRQAIWQAQQAATAPMRQAASLDALRTRDPNLTESDLFRRVTEMSRILREAWCAGDMRPARPFVSDGVYSRFQVQLAMMRQENRRNLMSDAQVLFTTLEAVESEPPFDTVHVRFTAQARDVMVPVQATQDQIAQALRAAPVEPYTEIWSLVRKHGATTKLDPSQIGKACPSCGAPLDASGEILTCKYCRALVCSGEFDWVLAEITQTIEWHPSSGKVDGLDALRNVDAQVAQEALEDRASYVFWKWLQANREGTPAKLRKCSTTDFVATRAQLGGSVAQSKDAAVGGADLLVVDRAPTEAEMDHVYVKIYWSAIFPGAFEATPVQSVLRLARKTGVTSKLSMTALVCAQCGAGLTDSDSTRCDHCNAELAAGAQAWVLDAILPAGTVPPRRGRSEAEGELPPWLLPDIADPRERMLLFTQMASMMASDGVISRRERKLITMCARRWAIPDETVRSVLAHPQASNMLTSASPQWFLAGLVSAAMIDGKVDAQERTMLLRACSLLSLPASELDRQLAAVGQRMRAQGMPAEA